ncbi:MAG: hypothetical protein JW953_02655 [Anaerolineae bacterium]|nr:hypothetical protein [Anaerolineae bacterium]
MKERILSFVVVILFIVGLVLFLPVLVLKGSKGEIGWLAFELAIGGYGEEIPAGEDGDGDDTPSPPPDQVDPHQNKMARDPNTPGIYVWFPQGATSVPVEVRTYYSSLPPGLPALPGNVGSPFFFGAWIRGEGVTLNKFNPPIVLNAPYGNAGVSQRSVETPGAGGLSFLSGWPLVLAAQPALPLLVPSEVVLAPYGMLPPTQEQQLRLNMYNPATESWEKLCSSVNVYTKRVSGVLALPTPFEAGGNTLLAIAVDDTPPLSQVVDEQGMTTLSLEGVRTRLQVLPGTVEQGVHFEVTLLAGVPDQAGLKLLADPIDIKACQVDHIINEKSTQITQFSKPLGLEFDYEADILASAGGKANVTIVVLQNGQWADLEEFGYQVIRDEDKIKVDTDRLGTFSLAAR